MKNMKNMIFCSSVAVFFLISINACVRNQETPLSNNEEVQGEVSTGGETANENAQACTKDADCASYFCNLTDNLCTTKDYLAPGLQTVPGKFVAANLDNIATEDKTPEDALKEISSWISSSIMHSNYNKNISLSSVEKGSSTAEELIGMKKHAAGCTDFGVMFVTLARAKGYPTIYVDTYDLSFLNQLAEGVVPSKIEGHVFVLVRFNDEWHAYDPVGATFFKPYDDPACGNDGCFVRGDSEPYKVVGKGVDYWDLGFKNVSEANRAICASYGLTCQ